MLSNIFSLILLIISRVRLLGRSRLVFVDEPLPMGKAVGDALPRDGCTESVITESG